MPEPDFDPRRAALKYAADAGRISAAKREDDLDAAGVNAIACALVYVGDEIREAARQPAALQIVLPNASAVTAWRAIDEPEAPTAMATILLDAVARIAHHEEHMGSGPADDEMREIARDALRKVGRDA